jgi:diguanylate cyclase (GGDEF)-like protein/PAS domain S-box-containing protein
MSARVHLSELAPVIEDGPFYKNLVDNLYDGVYFVDRVRRIIYWSQGAERLTGYTAREAIGRSCFENFLMHVDGKGHFLCVHGCPLQQTVEDGVSREAEIYLRHKTGHRVPVRVRVSPIRNGSGRIVGAVEIFTDISHKNHAERRITELERFAFLDHLTGVPNRRFTALKIQQTLQEVQEFKRSAGLLMFDVDHFKEFNDAWGHDVGDLMLQAVSQTLVRTLRPGDIIGRWGGEEFLVILMDVDPGVGILRKIAERCRRLVATNAVSVDKECLRATVSVGATILLDHDSAESAIKRVDELMYRGKRSGRNQTRIG